MGTLNVLSVSALFFIFVVLTAVQNVAAEEPPKRKESNDQKSIIFALANETVMLKCPVQTLPDYTTFVEWMKGNISLYNEQGYEITPKGYLKIKAASEKHSGMYTCEAVNGYGSIRVNLTLIIDDQEMQSSNFASPNRNSYNRIQSSPPSIIKRSSSVIADEGGEAFIHCIASGQPVPRIFWIKDGELIRGSSSYSTPRKIHSSLKLKGLKQIDSGDYKCIARNMRGQDETNYKLLVLDSAPPPKIITLDPKNITIQKGASIAFVCEVHSKVQNIHMKWLKKLDGVEESDDKSLFYDNGAYYQPLNLRDSELILDGKVYISKLFIRNSREEDSGTYICLALNDKGFNYSNCSLNVLKVIASPKKHENQPNFSLSIRDVGVILSTIGFLLLLAVVVLLSHKCCKYKSEERRNNNTKNIRNIELTIQEKSILARKPNKGENMPYPEIGDPSSTSKLLSIDSAFIYDHNDKQVSKSTHTKTSFY